MTSCALIADISFTCTDVAKPTQTNQAPGLPLLYFHPVGCKPLGNFRAPSFHLIIPLFSHINQDVSTSLPGGLVSFVLLFCVMNLFPIKHMVRKLPEMTFQTT